MVNWPKANSQHLKANEVKENLSELDKLNKLIDKKPEIDLLYQRAKLLMSFGENAKAINDYYHILSIDKDEKLAKVKIEYLKTILRYTNTDIYANPNTNLDPWLE